jgi:hypothetical protein
MKTETGISDDPSAEDGMLPKRHPDAEDADIFLSSAEVVRLTGRKRPTHQAQALRGMGIENRLNPAGQVIVLRRHLEEQLGMKSGRRSQTRSAEPNWSALNHAKTSSKRK